jgi:carboxypeptidase Taq
MSERLQQLKQIDKEYQLLSHVSALLHWDQETCIPAAAVPERAEQRALLHGLMHDRITNPEIGEALTALGVSYEGTDVPSVSDGYSDLDKAFLRELARVYRRSIRVPRRIVTELARQTAIGQQVWVEARRQADFSIFLKQLSVIVGLVREVATCLGYQDHPYDPLLDEYEPWMSTAEVEEVFSGLRSGLSKLLRRIVDSGKTIDTSFLHREYDAGRQREFSVQVLKTLGYDFERGRLDESAHPFTTSLGYSDVRITTRYSEDFLPTSIFGTIHECGHALYDTGFAEGLRGSLLAQGTSLGIHESQSRMWENFIGRSLPFWNHFFPILKQLNPKHLGEVKLRSFYEAVNAVAPSLIRIEADEVTYNLHIVMRFELEKQLISGELAVEDLPAAWNAQSQELLGIVAPDDAQGVLQDIHWSSGLIGYFPTYSLGNLYAAQFFKTIEEDLPDWAQQVQKGRFEAILGWLRQNIHSRGRVHSAKDLCLLVCGEPLSPRYLLDHLEQKYSDIYGL